MPWSQSLFLIPWVAVMISLSSCGESSFSATEGAAATTPSTSQAPKQQAAPSPAGAPSASQPWSSDLGNGNRGGNQAGATPVTLAVLAAANSANVDASCHDASGGSIAKNAFTFPVKTTPPAQYGSCSQGFEINEPNGSVTLTSKNAGGTAAVVLSVDVANYVAPNFLRIEATSPLGTNVVVLDTCTMRTACYADPTDGTCRPPEDSIRTFNVTIPAGTTSLQVFFDGSSPSYVRILGLCDFNLQTDATQAFRSLSSAADSATCSGAVTSSWRSLPAPVASRSAGQLMCN